MAFGRHDESCRVRLKAMGVCEAVLSGAAGIHVLEYLWRAAWSFYAEGDADAETWVRDKALDILGARASIVGG